MDRKVLVVENELLDVDAIGSPKPRYSLVHDVEEGVNRRGRGDGIIVFVGLEAIEGRSLSLRGGHFVGNFQMVVV